MISPLDLLRARLPEGPHYGLLARFEGPSELMRACERVRDEGYTRWDAHTPFPVHGLEGAMGLRASLVPWIVFVLGMSFAVGGMLLQWWTSAADYPLVISGKPLFSWPAFVPITFELGVLGGALGAVFGMLALNKLPTLHHPLFHSKAFERVSDDAFFISVESWDPRFDAEGTARLLREAGAVEVELIPSEGQAEAGAS